MSNKFQKLTPDCNINLGIYQETIEYAFSESDIRNVAISGAYGAGKSSVIETFKAKNPDKKFIHISLAHFANTQKENESIDEKVLEGKIINQLIHQIHPDKIPLTNFKVKRDTDDGKLLEYMWWCTGFFVLLLFVVFNKQWCEIMTAMGVDNGVAEFFVSKGAVFFAGFAWLAIAMKGVHTLIKIQTEKKFLKKVNVQGNEFEIFEDCEESYFDKYLNEVLYLFEKSDADAIVFEDIDRFDSNLIFEKLREINTLLRNSGVQIRFFYLLRDDVFESSERTKFFDLIIPVVPVIDSSNAYEKFYKHFKEARLLGLFRDEFLRGLGIFVDDMRILKNIQNEFVIYYETLNIKSIGLDWNKLLAMITYKNLFPKDFSDLQVKQGYVYTLFANKDEFRKLEMQRLTREIEKIDAENKEIEKEFCQNIEELDAICFAPGKRLKVNNKEEFQFANRAAFVKEIKDNMDKVYYYSGSYPYQWSADEVKKIFEKMQNSDEYKKRKEVIEKRKNNVRNKNYFQKASLENERLQLQRQPLKNLITRENKMEIFDVAYSNALSEVNNFESVKRSPYFDLIQYLIKEGYIDESYADYMTYFYENSIRAGDRKFVRGVLGENAYDYNYALEDPHRVMKELELKHFAQIETLNFDLLDCLLLNKEKYKEQLKAFLQRIYEEEPADFVAQYLQRGSHLRNFVREMNKEWNGTCGWILSEEAFETARAEYIIATLCVSSDEIITAGNHKEALKEYVETNIAAVAVVDEAVPKIFNGIILLGAKVRRVNFEKMNITLLTKIYQNNAYELSAQMVEVMLECFYGFAPDDIDWESNLTQIFTESEEPLCLYVKENIAEYIKVVLGQTVTIFDEEPVVLYVLNHESIDDSDKRKYIGQLMSTITLLEAVNDIELWPLIMKEEIVAEDAKNMCEYYFKSGNEMDEQLIRYINESESILTVEKIELDKVYGEGSRNDMYQAVLRCEELDDERYEKLILSFRYHYTKFSVEGLPLNKLLVLIRVHMIWMTESNLKFLRTEYPDALQLFIQKNIEEYIKLVQEKGIFEKEELVYLLMEYPTGISFVDEGITQLAAEHTEYVMEEALPIDLGLMKSLLSGDMIEKDQKKELLALLLPEMKKTDVVECLKLAGLDKFHSIFLGKRPSFEMIDANEKLLKALEDNHLISSFSEDKQNEGYYKAYGKRR